jgi:hypothetical protein
VICAQYLKAMKAAMTKREGIHVRKKTCANTPNLVRRCTLAIYLDKSRNGAFCKLCERHASGDTYSDQTKNLMLCGCLVNW